MDEDTLVGPMISEKDAQRVESWLEAARQSGAKIEYGGLRRGHFIEPTICTNVPLDTQLYKQEIFGPVCVVEPYDSFDEAIEKSNSTAYGLQVGLFSNRFDHIMSAYERLDFGGVVINDVPTKRIDAMPYGGVKDSGTGREGLKYAMQEMAEIKTLLIRDAFCSIHPRM
eukprot:TRINITY_DN12409_c0_g1_i1.p1 TRINITY_DN12409_c0_g1~~TRINITY_DN12409_c0_g1_i1.p1  ORF type:complete len:169 (+),score=19.70 TRINITY_DN12409_c0_g1_i1:432-938(+)